MEVLHIYDKVKTLTIFPSIDALQNNHTRRI